MYQELQYLREELNQRLCLHLEHGTKTINIVLITWGSFIAFCGAFAAKFTDEYPVNAIFYFMGATILFVSNVILHSMARKYYDDADALFRLGAYILVFYDRRPSSTAKVGKHFSWESANFEITTRDIYNNRKRKNSFYKRNDEYKILSFISLVFILFLSVALFFVGGKLGIVLLSVCVFYTVFSTYLFHTVSTYTSLKDNYGMKIKHLNDYFQYSLDTKHYTEQEINNRFGDIYEICKQYMQKQKSSKRKRAII